MASNGTSVIIVRSIDAPVERVFAAWTNSEQIQKWFAPNGSAVSAADVVARNGGSYRVEVVDADWNRHVTAGTYEELIPNRLIVKSCVYEGPKVPNGEAPTRLGVMFRETPSGGTELTLIHEHLASEQHKEEMRQGWSECFDKLESLMAREW